MRLIDADKLKEHYAWWAGGTYELSMDAAKVSFDTIVDNQPTITERTAKWEAVTVCQVFKCSACGNGIMTKNIKAYKYCPNCGARMVP